MILTSALPALFTDKENDVMSLITHLNFSLASRWTPLHGFLN